MNPLTNVRNIKKLSEKELEMGLEGGASWHHMYKDSSWIFIGGLNFDLTEGDIICVFSQYGEVVNINLVREKTTGKSRGFAFLCYEDQRSTILAVDNLNGIKLVGRIIRVDHVQDYKMPKEHDDMDEATKKLHEEGCAPKPIALNEVKVKSEDRHKSEGDGKRKEEKHSKHRHHKKHKHRSGSREKSRKTDKSHKKHSRRHSSSDARSSSRERKREKRRN